MTHTNFSSYQLLFFSSTYTLTNFHHQQHKINWMMTACRHVTWEVYLIFLYNICLDIWLSSRRKKQKMPSSEKMCFCFKFCLNLSRTFQFSKPKFDCFSSDSNKGTWKLKYRFASLSLIDINCFNTLGIILYDVIFHIPKELPWYTCVHERNNDERKSFQQI